MDRTVLPSSGMGDYLEGAEALLRTAPDGARVFGAHRTAPPGAPELLLEDVRELRDALQAIRDGSLAGTVVYAVVYRVNARIDLWTEPGALQRWEARR